MFLRNLDLLSSPPRLYFKQKKTNQTLFGGVLFLIFIIISIIIAIIYLLDFFLTSKYDITYTLYKDFTADENENNQIEDYNPHLNFTFDIKKISNDFQSFYPDNTFLLIDSNFVLIENNITIYKTPSDMSFFVVYSYINDCDLDKIYDENYFYVINMSYSGYKIDHNQDNPLEKNNDKYTFYKEFYFTLEKSSLYNINWEVTLYKEEKGLFDLFDKVLDIKNEYTAIDIDSIEQINTEEPIELKRDIGNNTILNMKVLSYIHMRNNHNKYIEYKRVKKSILDVLANIGALIHTLYSIFSFVFSFYSINFDNYKLVKEIFFFSSLNSKKNTFKSTLVSFDNTILKNKPWESYEVCSTENKKTISPDNKEINKLKNKDNQITITETQIIPDGNSNKINCIYFILENVFCKREKMKKEFKIINICNDIIYKYLSIDNILYNQILFENLLNDYIWNDNNLKMIENYNLLKKFKLEFN